MTYVPPFPQDLTLEDVVLRELEHRLAHHGVHTIYPGHNLKAGRETGDMAVVCVVDHKTPMAQNQLPPWVVINGQKVLLDVIEEPKPNDLRCYLPDFETQAQNDHQRCHKCPVPGGVQIAPQGKNWVGTLGCALKLPEGYGLLTNEHVSGVGAVGTLCCQHHGGSGWIGKFIKTGGIRFDGQPNYIDAAVALAQRSDGPYAPGTRTVTPTQFGLGRIVPTPKAPAIGDTVRKSGRTTGVTTGRIVGINGTSRVGYGSDGTALFRNQIIIQGNGGLFSNSGDSGSLIVSQDIRPVGLLFAGGGGQTIANRIDYVLDWCKGEFY